MALAVLSALYIGGCRRAGSWLVKDDAPAHADAMVILMGSFPERVLQAVDLWQEGKSDRVIIVEESMGPFQRLEERGVRIETNSEQAVRSLIALGVPADSITLLAGDARSTIDEAVAVCRYLSGKHDTDTILIVSSAPHMRRASIIFRTAMRKAETPVNIRCCPSSYSRFNAIRWWRRKEDIQAVLSEYLKIGSFIVIERKKI